MHIKLQMVGCKPVAVVWILLWSYFILVETGFSSNQFDFISFHKRNSFTWYETLAAPGGCCACLPTCLTSHSNRLILQQHTEIKSTTNNKLFHYLQIPPSSLPLMGCCGLVFTCNWVVGSGLCRRVYQELFVAGLVWIIDH